LSSLGVGFALARRNSVVVGQPRAPIANAKVQESLSKEVVSALQNSPVVTLYSIHPTSSFEGLQDAQRYMRMAQPKAPPIKELFRGYPVWGKTVVSGAQKNVLLQAFYDGIAKPFPMAGCFSPHHALRVQSGGKSYDFVICFSCSQFSSSGSRNNQPIHPEVEPVFDAILKNAGVPLAG
jgi:hypothetical protein